MNGSDREWQLLQRQLDRIESKQDKMLTREEFREYKVETAERMGEMEEDIQEIKEAAVSPDQVSKMVGEGMREADARGWTQRDRIIRYGLAALSLGTFILLVIDKWPHNAPTP